jgi:hypothetical protein
MSGMHRTRALILSKDKADTMTSQLVHRGGMSVPCPPEELRRRPVDHMVKAL